MLHITALFLLNCCGHKIAVCTSVKCGYYLGEGCILCPCKNYAISHHSL